MVIGIVQDFGEHRQRLFLYVVHGRRPPIPGFPANASE
jgi:hypothetical protein